MKKIYFLFLWPIVICFSGFCFPFFGILRVGGESVLIGNILVAMIFSFAAIILMFFLALDFSMNKKEGIAIDVIPEGDYEGLVAINNGKFWILELISDKYEDPRLFKIYKENTIDENGNLLKFIPKNFTCKHKFRNEQIEGKLFSETLHVFKEMRPKEKNFKGALST